MTTLRLGAAPTYLVWLAVACQFVASHSVANERLQSSVQSIKVALARGTNKSPYSAIYRELQAAIPDGATVAVMLDDPYLLDYARNEIFNLDLVGFAAPPPGLPSFLGPERMRAYFTSHGIRYVAFIDGNQSMFLYRRFAWMYRMYSEGELWRFMGAHAIDASDTLSALKSTSRVLFDRYGFVVLDLGTAPAAPAAPSDAPEIERQDAFMRQMSETELHTNAWQLASRHDVVFEPDGVGPGALHVGQNPPGDHSIAPVGQSALERFVAALTGPPPLEPVESFRYLADRTHVRVHGKNREHLHIKIRIYWEQVASKASNLIVTLGDRLVGRATPDADGFMTLDADVACHGWCDLYLDITSVPEYWRLPDDVKGIKLLELRWDALR